MKKLKTLNYKILSTLPVISVCLATTQQTSSAMLRSSFSRVLQTSSKNTITTTSPQTLKYLYRNGARVSIFDSNPLKNTNPNSSFSIKNSSVNPPTASTNIYRNSRTLSVIGNDILQNNNGNYTPLNLTSKLTPYSPTNTQQPISNKNSNPTPPKTTYDSSFNPENFGKNLGNLMGHSLSKVLELKQTKFLYDWRNGNKPNSAMYTQQNIIPTTKNIKNNTFISEAKTWGTILGNSMSASLNLTATNINPSILSQIKNN